MVVEASLRIEQRKDGGVIGKVIRKRKCKKRLPVKAAAEARCDHRSRGVLAPVLLLRRLFATCREVFRGPDTVPSPEDVRVLSSILDGMKPEDVGLSRNLQFFKPNTLVEGNQRVTYTTIYRCENFSLCIFFLPATSVIPLHNHPGMTVFSKLLLGTMHIKAYDWVDDGSPDTCESSPGGPRLARLKVNKVFTAPCDASVLYPTSGGNIHEFRAVTPCAVLDVMGPPYSKDDGRDCSYYRDTPCDGGDLCHRVTPVVKTAGEGGESGEGMRYGWLEEIEMAEDSEMDVIQYMGPQVI